MGNPRFWEYARPLRAALIASIAVWSLTVADRSAAQEFASSAYAVAVALPACDEANPEVRIIDQVADWAAINDPSLRVFCVRPGNYSAAGVLRLETSGTSGRPRVIRYHDPLSAQPPHPVAQPSSRRAVVQGFALRGAHRWVIDGLTIQGARVGVLLLDARHNVLNGLLLQDVIKNHLKVDGVSSHNVLQSSVLRRTRIAPNMDTTCAAFVSPEVGEEQRGNRLVQNEISDCGDAVLLHLEGERTTGGRFPGLVIDGNDLYLTPARYSNCRGVLDRRGPCACAENGIDVKIGGTGSAPGEVVTISNNRIWGWRPTDRGPRGDGENACGASGSQGDLMTIHRVASHVAIVGNRLFDGPRGISLGAGVHHVSVEGNLVYDIARAGTGFGIGVGGPDTVVRSNVVVRSGMWLGLATDATQRTLATCNVVVDSGAAGGKTIASGSRFDGNTYFATSQGRFAGSNDLVFPDTSQASSEPLCFWRKRWTAPERVCVPYGGTATPTALAGMCGSTVAPPAAPRMLGF